MESKVYQGQSFLDKVIEMTGSADNAFAMALENNVSITDSLAIGTLLTYSGTVIKSISSLFNDNNRCATAITKQNHELIVADEGIGAMIIENTFIIG
ncbi:hypothetical protein [Flavobacterium sp. LB2P53]|uniref:hypothetical protein n=1 Tax=Flavobacterium sp. LB2P53 TaxID=2497481 RepID=UPI000F81CDD7|nr:hypothetical protein [Flavobacterium sp. LB2P53]RTY71566.1 hypothetical protein EKL95_02365 [Flavobacterium sp. LB2P53]